MRLNEGQPLSPVEVLAPCPVEWQGPAGMSLGDWLQEQLFERRIVLVTGQLDDDAAAQVAAALLTLDVRSDKPIELHLAWKIRER
jgi:ATP-dependent protease ClpP protease subunit